MRYIDPNIGKVINLLAQSKEALDATLEAAREYAEADKDVQFWQDALDNDLEYQKDNPDTDWKSEIESSQRNLDKAKAEYAKAAEVLRRLALNLDDNLGSAGRVSDHYKGKVYPLGMSPL